MQEWAYNKGAYTRAAMGCSGRNELVDGGAYTRGNLFQDSLVFCS